MLLLQDVKMNNKLAASAQQSAKFLCLYVIYYFGAWRTDV